MQVIDQINGSALFAQSAYSASIATKDSLGQDITATYLTGINIPESATWNDVSETVQTNSAQWSQGGTTYTSPSGTILINDDTLEASTSGFGTTVKIVNVTLNYTYTYFSAIPGYPFDTYSAERTSLTNHLYLRYGDWDDGFYVSDAMTANIIEIPLTSGGYNLWFYKGQNVKISAVKTGVVELVKKDDLLEYTTNVEKNALSASLSNSISSVSSNLYELSGKTITGSKLGTIIVTGHDIEASTSATIIGSMLTDVVNIGEESFDYTTLSSLPNYPYEEYLVKRPQDFGNHITCVYGNWNHADQVTPPTNQTYSVPLVWGDYPLTMIGTFGTISAIKGSRQVVELALKGDLPTYGYDSTNKISAINGSAIAGQGGGGNPEVENYVQTNSANIDDTVTSFQTNSSTYITNNDLVWSYVEV